MNNLYRATFFCLLSTTCSISAAQSCNEAQAYNKMLALNRGASRIMNLDLRSGSEITMESGKVSEIIAAKNYDEACRKSDELAKKYKIDLATESKGLVTFEEMQKDGGKRGGECSQADASIKMMGLHQQLEDKAALGDVSRDVFRTFGADTAKLSDLLMTDPSEMCRRLEALKPKYGLK